MSEIVGETYTILVQKNTAFATESLCGQELRLCRRVLGVNETGRMHLNLIHVDVITTDGHDHLMPITSGMRAVGC